MLTLLDYTLKSSFEGVLLLVALVVYSSALGLKSKDKWLWAGTTLAFGFAIVLVYTVRFWGNRELFEFIWLSSTLIAVGILIAAGYLSQKITAVHKALGPLVLLSAVLLLTVEGIELVAFPAKIFVQARSFLSTDLILKVIGALAGILLAALFGWTYIKSSVHMGRRSVVLTAGILVLVVLSRQLITLLQLGMALGYIPVTPFLVSIVAPVINTYYPLFFYSLVVIVAAQILLARFQAKAPQIGEFANPAQKRKMLAVYRNHIRWLAVSGVLILSTGVLLGAGYVESNKKVKLSPPVEVKADNGLISIPVSQVNDTKLHRFSYETKDKVTMRFIVVAKGNGLFGVGLDACEICGVVGYYQRGDNVVCVNCDVIINKQTIGFPGGCNPIPFANKVEKGSVVIKVEDLEQKQKVFEE